MVSTRSSVAGTRWAMAVPIGKNETISMSDSPPVGTSKLGTVAWYVPLIEKHWGKGSLNSRSAAGTDTSYVRYTVVPASTVSVNTHSASDCLNAAPALSTGWIVHPRGSSSWMPTPWRSTSALTSRLT